MKFPGFSKRWIRVLLHIAFWLLLFSLPYLLRPAQESTRHNERTDIRFFYQYLVSFSTWIGLFYINSHLLIPVLLNRKKYRRYFLSLVPIFGILLFINWLSFELMLPQMTFSFKGAISFYLLPCVFILSSSTAITMFQNKLQTDHLAQQKENENLKTELAFLRSQVSPHFMFNVLNNMVVLARKKSEQLEPSLFKLSSLLRYMLYETDEEKVLLDREIEYLQDYIDLQLQRFGSKVAVNTKLELLDNGLLIEPMLLIPFVENAFKHSTGLRQKGEISIKLTAYNKLLEFEVTNRYDPAIKAVKDKTSGIGLQNVRRRLDLLYKDQHSLLIENENNTFSVSLKIKLH